MENLPDNRPFHAGVKEFVLYGRVSSEEQKQNKTIDAQVQTAQDFEENSNQVLAKCYLDDGVNGDLPWEQRPAARELLADARAGRVPGNTVAVYLFDRFSRDVLEGLLAARELSEAGITLFSLLENYDITTPQGRYMFIDSLNNAQRAKALLKQRTADGQRRKARAGGWLGGDRAAYGYKVEGKRNASHIVLDLSPVPEFGQDATRVSVAAWIFEQVGGAGRSCVSVADDLNLSNVPAYSGGEWSAFGIARMVRNPVYMGQHHYGDEVGKASGLAKITAAVPAIVSPELWAKTKAQVAANQRWAAKNRKRDYLLRGIIFCGDCGAAYTGLTLVGQDAKADATENREGVLYRCNARASKRNYPNHQCAGGLSIPGTIEAVVWGKIVWWLAHPEQVKAAMEQTEPARTQTARLHGDELAHLTRALQAKSDERTKILTLFRRGRIDETALDAQLDEIDREAGILQTRLNEVQKTAQAFTQHAEAAQHAADVVTRLAARLQPGLLHAGVKAPVSWMEKRSLVVQLVERVTVHTGHLPPPGATGNGKAAAKRNAEVRVRFRFTPDEPIHKSVKPGGSCDSLTQGEGQINLLQQMVYEWHLPELQKYIPAEAVKALDDADAQKS